MLTSTVDKSDMLCFLMSIKSESTEQTAKTWHPRQKKNAPFDSPRRSLRKPTMFTW